MDSPITEAFLPFLNDILNGNIARTGVGTLVSWVYPFAILAGGFRVFRMIAALITGLLRKRASSRQRVVVVKSD